MITNDRQYRITKSKLDGFVEFAASFDLEFASERIGSIELAMAELDAAKSEIEVLNEQIKEYELLKSGSVRTFRANSLEELSTLLVRARIAKNLSQKELANLLGMKEQQIQRYESDFYSTANLRRLSEVAAALELDISEVAEFTRKRSFPRATSRGGRSVRQSVQWENFPVKEMYKRGWFTGFRGSLSAAEANRVELVEEFVEKTNTKRQPVFLRQNVRVGSKMDPYALWAWECRIMQLANGASVAPEFSPQKLDDQWFEMLLKASSNKNGPQEAVRILNEVGVHLIIEPHLKGTHLDGAAFLLADGSPVVGMTLRYDRLDNFWFVLIHELVHVRDDLRRGKIEGIYDDLDESLDELEKETDRKAGNILIPDEKWEIALPRYLQTEESVVKFAKELKIHPSIVAGRIRKESDNYVLLNSLVGTREVRCQFPDIMFDQ